jgi:hypothetical protein
MTVLLYSAMMVLIVTSRPLILFNGITVTRTVLVLLTGVSALTVQSTA